MLSSSALARAIRLLPTSHWGGGGFCQHSPVHFTALSFRSTMKLPLLSYSEAQGNKCACSININLFVGVPCMEEKYWDKSNLNYIFPNIPYGCLLNSEKSESA